MESVERQIIDACKHFNGIQHKECRQHVSYEQFRKPNGALVPLPCFHSGLNGDGCDKAEWWTNNEAKEKAKESRKEIAKYFQAIVEGKCGICKKPVKHRQVGHCVYGSCGHRLYQGTANPEFM